MAKAFVSTANSFFTSTLIPPSSSSSCASNPLSASTLIYPHKYIAKNQLTLCKAVNELLLPSPICTKRSLSVSFLTSLLFCFKAESYANAAILEADDDEELLERVKKDRKKRIEQQGVISSANKETGYLQDLVYKLSKIGQAIDNNDLSTAKSVLGEGKETDWVTKVTSALTKLSSSAEEKTQVDTFNSFFASLISAVRKNDVETSKTAFVSSASAFEKWTALTGLVGQLKGL